MIFAIALATRQTNSSAAPYSELTVLGSPVFSWNGGGTSFIQYNSCWANIGNTINYIVISNKEEVY